MTPPEPDPPEPEVTIPVTASVTGSATRVAMIITEAVSGGQTSVSGRLQIVVDPVSIRSNNSHTFDVPQSVLQGLVYTDSNNYQRLSLCYRNYNTTKDDPDIDISNWQTALWQTREIVNANASGTYADSYSISIT